MFFRHLKDAGKRLGPTHRGRNRQFPSLRIARAQPGFKDRFRIARLFQRARPADHFAILGDLHDRRTNAFATLTKDLAVLFDTENCDGHGDFLKLEAVVIDAPLDVPEGASGSADIGRPNLGVPL
mgnify:CR=1 FL=1